MCFFFFLSMHILLFDIICCSLKSEKTFSTCYFVYECFCVTRLLYLNNATTSIQIEVMKNADLRLMRLTRLGISNSTLPTSSVSILQ